VEQARPKRPHGLRSFLRLRVWVAQLRVDVRKRSRRPVLIMFRHSLPILRARVVPGRSLLPSLPLAMVRASSRVEARRREWSWDQPRLRISAKARPNCSSVHVPSLSASRSCDRKLNRKCRRRSEFRRLRGCKAPCCKRSRMAISAFWSRCSKQANGPSKETKWLSKYQSRRRWSTCRSAPMPGGWRLLLPAASWGEPSS
jgi:hypothetical protein